MYQTNYYNYVITGNDAKEFLQGQLSCDMEEVDKNPNVGMAAAYCLPDGKVFGYFYVSHLAPNTYLLTTNDNNAESFLKRLKMFILRSEVTIEPTDYLVYGSEQNTEGAEGENIPQTPQIKIPLNQTLQLFLFTNKRDENNNYAKQSAEQWNYLETLNGIPALNDQLRGKFILPFINLDWLGAVSYQKGCYVGQEIIARLHHRSKPAKRSFIYTTKMNVPLLALSETIACVDGENKPCRITPIRIATWENKSVAMIEMPTRHAPRDKLIITHEGKTYQLNCEPQPYQTQST